MPPAVTGRDYDDIPAATEEASVCGVDTLIAAASDEVECADSQVMRRRPSRSSDDGATCSSDTRAS